MKAGIVFSGCGVMDGTEIHEAVLTMLCLDRAGAEVVCMAPDAEQMHVVNHLTNEPEAAEHRSMLLEGARIARGSIRDMAAVGAADIDVLLFPGGFGAAKNLCTFAVDGADCRVNGQAQRLISEMLDAGKPLGALCIAPVLIARVAGALGRAVQVTVGNDAEVADAVNRMGAVHVSCTVDNAVVDTAHRVATSPAYMLASGIAEVALSAEAVVAAVMDLAR